jgi:hypothetical protein
LLLAKYGRLRALGAALEVDGDALRTFDRVGLRSRRSFDLLCFAVHAVVTGPAEPGARCCFT